MHSPLNVKLNHNEHKYDSTNYFVLTMSFFSATVSFFIDLLFIFFFNLTPL